MLLSNKNFENYNEMCDILGPAHDTTPIFFHQTPTSSAEEWLYFLTKIYDAEIEASPTEHSEKCLTALDIIKKISNNIRLDEEDTIFIRSAACPLHLG